MFAETTIVYFTVFLNIDQLLVLFVLVQLHSNGTKRRRKLLERISV